MRYFEGKMWGDGLLDEHTFRKHGSKRLRSRCSLKKSETNFVNVSMLMFCNSIMLEGMWGVVGWVIPCKAKSPFSLIYSPSSLE